MDELNKQQAQKILDISKDFYRFAKNNLWIKDKDARIVKFVPNIAQKELIDRVLTLMAEGKPVRVIVLKARQMGLSTAIEALIYWYTVTHTNITSAIIAHEDEASRNLYNMFKRYYDNSNILFKPSRKYDTRTDLKFAKEDEDGNQIGLNSVIKTATARNTQAGRSDTINLVHGSEVAFWENGEELVAALFQTVPDRPGTMVFLESTANGRGNFFAKQWDASVKGDSDYEPFFFPWWIQDEYERDEAVDVFTPEEEEIAELMREGLKIGNNLYKYDDETIRRKIAFRRHKERGFIATPEKLLQEYPSTPHEAFIASGQTVFDIKSLSRMEKKTKDTDRDDRYSLVQQADRSVIAVKEEVPVEARKHIPLRIWDLPEPGEEYVIGADVAEGLANGDYSVADVIRTRDMKTVAKFRGHPDPDQFGSILEKIGIFYNYALVGVEINNHGLTTVQRLRNLFYSNLYRREKGMDEVFEETTSKFGWKTDMRTKPMAIDYLAEAIREGYVIDEDRVFVEEAYAYVRDERGRTNAEVGSHDDTIMAKAIALQLFDWSENNKADLKVVRNRKYSSSKSKHKVIR